MKSKSFQLITVVIASLAIMLILAACSAQTADTPTDEPVTAETEEVQATETVQETEPTEEPTEVEATPTAEVAATEEATADSTTTDVSSQTASVTCSSLNLNTVTEDELLNTLPDFSSRMVREFFEYRPYVSIQQFRQEIGKYVSDDQVAAWEAYVYVPVAYNDSDAATLEQIPGVDETIAQSLINGRPYADQQAFIDALAASLTAEDLNQATCYLEDAS